MPQPAAYRIRGATSGAEIIRSEFYATETSFRTDYAAEERNNRPECLQRVAGVASSRRGSLGQSEGPFRANQIAVRPRPELLEGRARGKDVSVGRRRPMICMPTGRPSAIPAGIEAAGWPVKLIG